MNNGDILPPGFILLKDLADFCYDAIRAQVNEFVILCEAEMRKLEDTLSLSNAVWSLGKIIEKMGGCVQWVCSLAVVTECGHCMCSCNVWVGVVTACDQGAGGWVCSFSSI